MSSLDTRFTPTGLSWAFGLIDGALNGITFTQGDHPDAVLVTNWTTSTEPVAVWAGLDDGAYAAWPTLATPGRGAIVLPNQCAIIAVNTQAFSDPAAVYSGTAAGSGATANQTITFVSGSLS